jgi:hypothetical protein
LDVAITSVIVVKLRERRLVWEKELNNQENALVAREDNVVAVKHALGRARMECDAKRERVEAVR